MTQDLQNWLVLPHMPLILGIGIPVFIFFVAWSLIWKGKALWKAAQRGEKAWFVAILVINSAGILEILYLYFFSKRSKSK